MFSREVSTFEHRGWRFSSFRGPIATQAELAELSRALGLSASGAPPLPEETYPRNFIEIACDGLCLRVDAIEALRRWDSNQRREFPSPSVTAFDWTYGNDFGGALSTRREGLEVGIDADDQGGEEGPSAHVVAAPLRWTRYAEGLPLTRLTTREPILYYAEVILYADDLHDRGHAEVTAKIRVMPSCCLLLCRAFVRVDGVRVALHDTRWYIDFDEAAGQQVAPPPSPPHTATAAPPLDLPPPARGWEAVRPAATEDSGAATAAAGGAAPAAGATALLLCDEQQRGGAMGAVREALGLPPLQYSSPMLRADAALAAAGVHPAVAESMRARSQGGLGPAAATQEAALAGAGTVGAEEAAVAGGYDDGLPPHGGGGFSWAIDADEVAVLKPSDAGTWALRLRVRPAAAPGAAT